MGWDAGVTFGLFSVGGKDEDVNADETVRGLSTAEIQTDSVAVILPLQDPSSSLTPEEPLVQPVAAARRDLTSLQTGIPRPFGTLQRRLARSRRHLRHAQKKLVPVPIHDPTSQQPPFRASDSKPTIPTPDIISTHRRVRGPRRVLDWDRDPLLSDLGRALGALGWIRGGG
ncbi:hypothetical protein C8R47DRAFT_1137605 [Mycena vitilis]|nr:hypothetical protein C8R47DRAFT_1137605 [Mycena vitilis]